MGVLYSPTRVLFGCDGLPSRLAGRPERRVTLLLDSGVADSVIAATIRRQLTHARLQADVVVLTGAGTLESVLGLADRLAGTELVVGVGGGSLLDQAKLATTLRDNPAARRHLTVPQRTGLLALPPHIVRAVPLVLVPTTLGTGSELSTSACLDYPQGKRLIMGEALLPDVAVLDPAATATLPGELVAEGVLEALCRLINPYVGGHDDQVTEDALVEAIAGRLMTLGHRVGAAVTGAVPDAVPDPVRAEIAKLSGLSHSGWVHQGRSPYSVKGWLVTNELSSVLGVRKMTAVAAFLPVLWQAVADGDTRLGSAPRLARLWERLRVTDLTLPADPVAGARALIGSWGVHHRLEATPEQLAEVARRVVRSWGAGLPMLGGLSAAEVLAMVTDAAAAAKTSVP
ncbi:iron-containing alcohol dehydrogenase [Amycolatopsis sp. NBC_00345]|uniref:daptide-type RiPP biosynthesis dehydogenase n=1 Tax=Amycolatopsis sp. NBC_00345 TaxID=2975955 RepID=UPI002E26F1B2